MAEDPNIAVLTREYPILRKLVGTWGEDYTGQQLQRLARFLWRFFDVPDFESGCEAFVRFCRCDTWRTFGGWRLLQVAIPADLPEVYEGQRAVHVEESNLASVNISADTVLNAARFSELEAIGSRIGVEGPRAFLLWENSD